MTTLAVKILPLVESMNLKNTQTNNKKKKNTEKKTPADLSALEGVKSFRGDLEDITV